MLRVQTLPSFVLVAPICYIDSIHNDQFVHKIMCRGQSSNSIYTKCSKKWLVVRKIASLLIIVVYVYCSLHSIYFQMPVSIMIHFCNPILKLLACIIQYTVVTSGATGTCMRKHVISLILCAWILFTLCHIPLWVLVYAVWGLILVCSVLWPFRLEDPCWMKMNMGFEEQNDQCIMMKA